MVEELATYRHCLERMKQSNNTRCGVVGTAGLSLTLLIECQLFSEEKVLRGESAPGTEEILEK